MAQTLEQGDIFGRIGKAIGQGAGEQIERGTLGRGLEKIAKTPNLTEIERFSKLSRLPGGLEHAQTIIPMLRNQQEISRIKKRREGETTPGQPTEVAQNIPESQNIPEERRQASDYLVNKSREEVRQLGEDLYYENPSRYPNLDAAIAEAATEDQSRVAKEQAYENRVNLGRDELNREVNLFLQKSGNEIYKDATGELVGQYESLLRNDIDNGKNPKLAAADRAKEILQLAKARQQVSVEGTKKAYAALPSTGRKILHNIREDYKKADQLELYKKDLINKVNMTPPFASALAYPPNEHKEISSSIKSYRKNPEKSFQTIADDLGKNDSLLAIALGIEEYAGRGKGQQFLDKIAAGKKAGKIKLTEEQARELGDTFNPNPSLTDLWYTSITGTNKAGV